MNDDADEMNADDYKIENIKTTSSKSFDYKTKIIWNTPVDNHTLMTHRLLLY